MKLLNLNIRSGGNKWRHRILEYIETVQPDIAVLTEFRHGESGQRFVTGLSELGLVNFATTDCPPTKNTVGIFAREQFTHELFPVLGPHSSRVLKAKFDGLDIYGVYFGLKKEQISQFRLFLDGEHRQSHRNVIITGDFNTGLHDLDETGKTCYCSELFVEMQDIGFRDAWRARNADVREYSWYSNLNNGFRIDHLLASESVEARISRIYYDHTPREKKFTDHSALIADLG